MPKKDESMTPFVSIIIPCRNEERYIEKCLSSIINSTYPKECLEVLIIDGQSDDNTQEIVRDHLSLHPYIRLLENPKKNAPSALNIGVLAAKGDYIVRMDAHAEYPKDYCEQLISQSISLEAANIGGICKTENINSTNTSNAIKNVLQDPLGVGNSLFRTGITSITETDTVPFGCYSKKIFSKYGLYDERLIRNQDIEFNKRLIRGGEKIYLLPDITCTYYARETYRELAKNNYQNGYWNILTAYYTGTLRSLSLRHFIPLAFVVSIILPILISPICPQILLLPFTIFIIYILIIAKRSWDIKHKTTWLCQIWAFITLHFSYGFGSIGGIIALTKKILFRDSK